MINEDRAEAALLFLTESDAEHARLRSEREALLRLSKRVLAQSSIGYMVSEKMPQGKAQDAARASEEYNEVLTKIEQVELEYFKLSNQRDTAHVLIDLFRSLNANRRMG